MPMRLSVRQRALPRATADDDDAEMVEMQADFERRKAEMGFPAQIKSSAKEYSSSVRDTLSKGSGGPSLLFVGGQAVLLVLLAVGDVPFLGGLASIVLGPGLAVGGVGAIVAGVVELGPKNLSPFPTPVEENELKTGGIFAISRHPIYAGLVVAAAGLSVCTESFQRALVVCLLYALLDAKADYEEKCLEKAHPGYLGYKQVTPKFFPRLLTLGDEDDDLDFLGR